MAKETLLQPDRVFLLDRNYKISRHRSILSIFITATFSHRIDQDKKLPTIKRLRCVNNLFNRDLRAIFSFFTEEAKALAICVQGGVWCITQEVHVSTVFAEHLHFRLLLFFSIKLG